MHYSPNTKGDHLISFLSGCLLKLWSRKIHVLFCSWTLLTSRLLDHLSACVGAWLFLVWIKAMLCSNTRGAMLLLFFYIHYRTKLYTHDHTNIARITRNVYIGHGYHTLDAKLIFDPQVWPWPWTLGCLKPRCASSHADKYWPQQL